MEEVDLFIFDVYYETKDGVDYVRIRAEDEEHAEEKFRAFYPLETITEIECRGEA